jgi:hypothetical protein
MKFIPYGTFFYTKRAKLKPPPVLHIENQSKMVHWDSIIPSPPKKIMAPTKIGFGRSY